MKIRKAPFPVPDEDARLKPGDFADVLRELPAECVLIGGQAVIWWAERYLLTEGKGQRLSLTSRDIDFWGSREDLLKLAKALKKIAALPGEYDMTVLAGAFQFEAGDKKSAVEVLHTVPGLDHPDPEAVAVAETIKGREKAVLVLSPVSLAITKLHALRHFPQDHRNDLRHLEVCISASRHFIEELLDEDSRIGIWNCNRLIDAHALKATRRLEKAHGFKILEAIPIREIEERATTAKGRDKERLENFVKIQWPRVKESEAK